MKHAAAFVGICLLICGIATASEPDTARVQVLPPSFTFRDPQADEVCLVVASYLETPTAVEASPYRCGIVLAATGGAMYALDRYYRTEPWWQYRRPIHLEIDNKYAVLVDKAGHVYSQNLVAKSAREFYHRWVGFDRLTAAWLGFGTSAVLQCFTEFGYDSRGPYFGADLLDVGSGLVGASLIPAREYWPLLRGLNLKWSFVFQHYDRPSSFVSDYGSQTYWAAIDIPGLKPFSLAIGLNRSDERHFRGRTQWWVSPDINWVDMFGDTWWSEALNSFKLPFFKVQFHPRFIVKGVAWSF